MCIEFFQFFHLQQEWHGVPFPGLLHLPESSSAWLGVHVVPLGWSEHRRSRLGQFPKLPQIPPRKLPRPVVEVAWSQPPSREPASVAVGQSLGSPQCRFHLRGGELQGFCRVRGAGLCLREVRAGTAARPAAPQP